MHLHQQETAMKKPTASEIAAVLMAIVVGAVMLTCSKARASEQLPMYSEVGKQGESMDDLVVRSARKLALITKGLNAEVCGVITLTDDGVYQLQVQAHGSNHHCQVRHSADTVIFHTHTEHFGWRFSRADYAAPGYMIRGRKVCWQNGVGSDALVTAHGRSSGSTCASTL
jgi:hypothetical protein